MAAVYSRLAVVAVPAISSHSVSPPNPISFTPPPRPITITTTLRRRRRRRSSPPSLLACRATNEATQKQHQPGVEQQRGLVFKNETPSTRESSEIALVGVPPIPPSTSTYFGSPLLWIGVGVGLSVVFSWGANSFKKYAMQQVFKSMLGQNGNQFGGFPTPPSNQFGGLPVTPGSLFPLTPSTSELAPKESNLASTAASAYTTIEVPATEVSSNSETAEKFDESSFQEKKPAFTDVDPEVIVEQRQTLRSSYNKDQESKQDAAFVSEEEANSSQSIAKEATAKTSNGKNAAGKGSLFTVEMLEQMMDDPTIQNMVYPYLPEEMRNPTTYKWMMQNPQYRQQLQEMLNTMNDGDAWDSRMSDLLKNFDLNTQDVKQQFEQLGVSPEEAIAKVMANPDVALAFQNPKVQAAIMDCSANPLNITKYQNDKEVMDVFNKISELFPGMSASPF